MCRIPLARTFCVRRGARAAPPRPHARPPLAAAGHDAWGSPMAVVATTASVPTGAVFAAPARRWGKRHRHSHRRRVGRRGVRHPWPCPPPPARGRHVNWSIGRRERVQKHEDDPRPTDAPRNCVAGVRCGRCAMMVWLKRAVSEISNPGRVPSPQPFPPPPSLTPLDSAGGAHPPTPPGWWVPVVGGPLNRGGARRALGLISSGRHPARRCAVELLRLGTRAARPPPIDPLREPPVDRRAEPVRLWPEIGRAHV